MAGQQEERPFLLLEPGEVRPEEARGDVNLFKVHGLERIAHVVMSGGLKPVDYLAAILGATEWRKGPGLELAPLADVFPSTAKPDWRPLGAEELRGAFSLQPGRYQLPEADKGIPVAHNQLGGVQQQQQRPASAAAAPSAATGDSKQGVPKKGVIKLKVVNLPPAGPGGTSSKRKRGG